MLKKHPALLFIKSLIPKTQENKQTTPQLLSDTLFIKDPIAHSKTLTKKMRFQGI